MSTFMKRNALFGSAAMFSLLAVLHAPTSLAGEGHSEHEQHHEGMNHDDMGHEKMMDKHGGTEAEAGSNHDH